MKIYIGIMILMLIIPSASHAQIIIGKVCYEKDRLPVPFASIALLHLPDSSMVTGNITLSDGVFNSTLTD